MLRRRERRERRNLLIRRLAAQGLGIRPIARELGITPRTVRRVLRPVLRAARARRPSLLDPFRPMVRELVLTYFEHYYNLRKEKTLRRYSRPVSLRRFDARGWMTSEDNVWFVPDYLCEIAHRPVLPPSLIPKLGLVDDRLFAAGLVGRTK